MLLDPSNSQHYDIMSAIRGPDDHVSSTEADSAKLVFTARIRAIIGVLPRDCMVRCTVKVSAYHIKIAADYCSKNLHYTSHVRTALSTLRDLNIGDAKELTALIQATRGYCKPLLELANVREC